MKFRKLHSWDLSPAEAISIQEALRKKIKCAELDKSPYLVAGSDVSFKYNWALGAIVILSLPELRIIEWICKTRRVNFPYIPGLLTFREGPVLEKCFKALKNNPDVIIFDGQGLAHPRNMGIATHLGILLDRPTIGCAKTRLYGEHKEPKERRGAFTYLFDPVRSKSPEVIAAPGVRTSNGVDREGKKIGAVLRTRDSVRPVYVSPGYKMDINSAIRLILMCVRIYRIPEALRLAHRLAQQ